ncbi:phage tail protein [Kosakonia cowanii]|nr:phage tail protein [Kosakonia cowanii]
MMNKIYYYDRSFYTPSVHAVIPEGAVEITPERHAKFAGVAWPRGRMLGTGADGGPAWVDAPPPTRDEQVDAAERKKRSLLAEAMTTVSLWQTELLLGSICDADRASLEAWVAYIKAVQSVDTSEAPEPDFVWPDRPAGRP